MGYFRNGTRMGQGTYVYASGTRYEGEYLDDLKHGQGKQTFKGLQASSNHIERY